MAVQKTFGGFINESAEGVTLVESEIALNEAKKSDIEACFDEAGVKAKHEKTDKIMDGKTIRSVYDAKISDKEFATLETAMKAKGLFAFKVMTSIIITYKA